MLKPYRKLLFGAALCLFLFSNTALLAAEKGHEKCENCHLSASPNVKESNTSLLLPPAELCLSCHKDRNGKQDHAFGIAPGAKNSSKLPLIDGLISCTTCHDSHATNEGLLRLPREEFCLACHSL
jgi:predicted CXXCH cytochrome family protein